MNGNKQTIIAYKSPKRLLFAARIGDDGRGLTEPPGLDVRIEGIVKRFHKPLTIVCPLQISGLVLMHERGRYEPVEVREDCIRTLNLLV